MSSKYHLDSRTFESLDTGTESESVYPSAEVPCEVRCDNDVKAVKAVFTWFTCPLTEISTAKDCDSWNVSIVSYLVQSLSVSLVKSLL